ncbi:MAG: ATP synthase subunit I [Prochlorothrix sp.]|nr:ATP synthase subunit I [Prochlorothrix sp.]
MADPALPSSLDESDPSPSVTSSETPGESVDSAAAMADYYALQQELVLTTLGITAIVLVSTWWFYGQFTALSYLLGACTGLVYLRLLSRSVGRLNTSGQSTGSQTRLALIAGLVIVATQWEQLQFLPVFLGFLTYKAALIVYTLRITLVP